MSLEANKAIIRNLIEEVWNKGNLAKTGDFLDTNVVVHEPPLPGLPPGFEGARQIPAMWRKGFPDLHITIDHLLAEGDKVAQHFTMHGTHNGEIFGIPPTGKQVSFRGINVFRIGGGKIVERWADVDAFGMMQQFGVIPTPGQTKA